MSEFTHRLPHRPWSKPSRNEEEYFRREEEFRRRMRAARKREKDRADTERQELRDRHQGRCPTCGTELEAMEIPEGRADQCPHCLGVWMDHEVFDALTHPDAPNEFLTNIFRTQFLQYTTGTVRPGKEKPSAARPGKKTVGEKKPGGAESGRGTGA